MIQTDEQRRWWFAVHPEYSWSRRGARNRSHEDEIEVQPAYLSEDIEAYVNEGLKYFPDGPVAALLKGLKWGLDNGDIAGPGDFIWNGADVDRARPKVKGSENPEDDDKELEATFWESVLHGYENFNNLEEIWIPIFFSGSSRKLGSNMVKAGKKRPPGHAAHHIVPENDKRFPEAEAARKILEKFQIDLVNPANGVWLPYIRGVTTRTYHPGVHTREYYAKVVRVLGHSTSKEKAIQILEEIGKQMIEGNFLK